MHIEAFHGKDGENNKAILEVIAFNNALIKYQILTELKGKKKITWATVSRRVDDLKERGYIRETGKRRNRVAKRDEDTPEYGLSWKGIIAVLTIKEIRTNITNVFNEVKKIDEYGLDPLNKAFSIIRKVFTEDEIRKITDNFNNILINAPIELELTTEEDFFYYLIPDLTRKGFFDKMLKKDIKKIDKDVLQYFYNFFAGLEEDYRIRLEAFGRTRMEIGRVLESGDSK